MPTTICSCPFTSALLVEGHYLAQLRGVSQNLLTTEMGTWQHSKPQYRTLFGTTGQAWAMNRKFFETSEFWSTVLCLLGCLACFSLFASKLHFFVSYVAVQISYIVGRSLHKKNKYSQLHNSFKTSEFWILVSGIIPAFLLIRSGSSVAYVLIYACACSSAWNLCRGHAKSDNRTKVNLIWELYFVHF